jgi:hypothetical protein
MTSANLVYHPRSLVKRKEMSTVVETLARFKNLRALMLELRFISRLERRMTG